MTINIGPLEKQQEGTLRRNVLAVQFGYGFISILLMIYIFIHLARSSKYANSFYRLAQVDLGVNIICWFNTWISIRSNDMKLTIQYVTFLERILPGFWNFSVFLANFFFHMQFCSAILMSIHRISAILFISSYDKFWRRWYLLVTTVFIVYSIIPQFAGLPTSVELVNDTLVLTSDSEISTAIGIRYAIFSVTYFILLIVIGITVARVALRKLQEIQGTNVDLNVSRKLTKIALTYGLLYSGVLGYSIASFINAVFFKVPDFIVKIQSVLLTTASDMITLSLPYVLLVFDSNIKRDLRRAIALPSTVVVVPSSSADTNGPV